MMNKLTLLRAYKLSIFKWEYVYKRMLKGIPCCDAMLEIHNNRKIRNFQFGCAVCQYQINKIGKKENRDNQKTKCEDCPVGSIIGICSYPGSTYRLAFEENSVTGAKVILNALYKLRLEEQKKRFLPFYRTIASKLNLTLFCWGFPLFMVFLISLMFDFYRAAENSFYGMMGVVIGYIIMILFTGAKVNKYVNGTPKKVSTKNKHV